MRKLLFTILILPASASFAQTSTNSPASATNTMCPFAYSSGVGYSPASNVMSSDNVYATVSHCDCCDQNTQCLTVTDFGFSIPAGAMIDGIVLEVEKKRSAGGGPGSGIVEDNGLQIIKGGVITGPNMSQYGVNWPMTDTYVSYGSSTDLWGTTWTPADINAPDFGVAMASISYVCGATIVTSIDHIRVTIHYTTATGIQSSAVSGGLIEAYPNPLSSDQKFSIPMVNHIDRIVLSDANGKRVFEENSRNNEITMPPLAAGVYFYEVTEGSTNYHGKLIIR